MKRKIDFRKILLPGLMMLFALHTYAQQTITGTVKDATTGEPLPGATVVVQGTMVGAVTDIDGKFTIGAETGNTLVVSFVGYETQEVMLGGETSLEINLIVSALGMDEVVVIGYGKVKKTDATGSVTSVSSDDFNRGAITTPQDLLVGKSAGVVITSAGGAPTGSSTIRIRGGSSLNASNDPLIIVDGVPISNNDIPGNSNILSFINPNDIESMSILKDASATAIYGNRASNGVIIITTKSGTAGQPLKISYNNKTFMSTPIEFMDVLSGDQMRQIAYDGRNLYGIDNLETLGSENTNWQQELYRNAISHDHNLSVSGSAGSLPYRASIGYTDQNGILKNTGLRRFTGSINLNPTLLDGALRLNVNAKGMNTFNNFGDDGALGSALNMDPTQPIYEDNEGSAGYFQWSNYGANLGTPNPVEQLLEVDNTATVNRVIANVQADYTMPFMEELRANLNIATDRTASEGNNNRPITTNPNLDGTYTGKDNNFSGDFYNDLIELYFNYNNTFGEQNLDVTAGYSWQHFYREDYNFSGGLITDTTDARYQAPVEKLNITENYLVSFFGRVNYSFMDKYLLTATARYDGSSRFSEGNRWGLFPSAAVAWKIHEESFLENVDFLTDLKLRASWGITGQQDITDNDYPAQPLYVNASLGSYYPINGEFLPTLRPDAYDPDIKWEETTTYNIGLDFGFFNQRVTGYIDVYKRITDDLLNTVTIPSGSNYSNTLLTNVGSLENQGIELAFEFIPISTPDMNLTFGLNGTYNQNTVTKLLLTDDPNYLGILSGDGMTGTIQVTRVGEPANSFFMNKQIYDQDGDPIEGLYEDLSGEGGTVNGDNNDKYVYNDPAPDYTFGFSARFNYKNFDFAANARANIGNYVYNQIAAGVSYDQVSQIGYWKNMPTYVLQHNFVKRQFTSDYFVENASFLKLDNISAGYTFENIVDQLSARVSFTVQNALIITNYSGIDPEVDGGVDNNFYPRPRTFMIGINLMY